jgi:Arc-like DNA binding domain
MEMTDRKLRLPASLSAQLDAAADANGVSKNSEMVRRLESTFNHDEFLAQAMTRFGDSLLRVRDRFEAAQDGARRGAERLNDWSKATYDLEWLKTRLPATVITRLERERDAALGHLPEPQQSSARGYLMALEMARYQREQAEREAEAAKAAGDEE